MSLIVTLIITLLTCLGCRNQAPTKHENLEKIEKPFHQHDSTFHQTINILSYSLHGDTLDIISDDNLVWRPFVIDLSVETLQQHYNNIFQVEKQNELVILREKENKIILYVNEPIAGSDTLADAEYHDSKIPQFSIKESIITSPSIALQYGIKIGMDKSTFFKMIKLPLNTEDINVVQIFDPPGDFIEQSYIFKNKKLILIEMRSPY